MPTTNRTRRGTSIERAKRSVRDFLREERSMTPQYTKLTTSELELHAFVVETAREAGIIYQVLDDRKGLVLRRAKKLAEA